MVVYLDDITTTYEVPGDAKYVCIDPEIYICGGPDLHKMKGLKSFNNFAGNLKYVYYHDVSILYELKQHNPKVHYIGVLDPEFEDIDIEVIPITYPFATSHIWWPLNQSQSVNLIFEFKTSKNMAVLAYSQITSGQGYWEVSYNITYDNQQTSLVIEDKMKENSDLNIKSEQTYFVSLSKKQVLKR